MESHILEYTSTNESSGRFEVHQCSVTVCRASNVVIATEISDGVEVTENVATIANEVVRQFDLDPRRLFFFEHYYRETPFENASLVEFCLDEGASLYNPERFHLRPSVLTKIKEAGAGPDYDRFNGVGAVEDAPSGVNC